jgi:hypothetical protein
MDNVQCVHCDSLITKQNLSRHYKSEQCIRIQKLIQQKQNIFKIELNKEKEQNELLKKENEKLKSENEKLNDDIDKKNYENKILQDKSEEYRKIVEKSATTGLKFKLREDTITDNNFQIDIDLNEKQLNKIKYKDVPEETVKNNLKSLQLRDNYQLEYREEDGYINVTNLCKAGGKQFKHWNSIDKTKKFLQILSTAVGKTTSDLIKLGTGAKTENDTKNHTWVHPQVAINIAQWISPEFDVLVSKWVYEIMLIGKVDIRDNKTTQELDKLNKENKLLKNKVKLILKKDLKKQPRVTYEDGKYVIYIVTTEYREAQGHYKIGKTQDLKNRMSTYNTSEKHEVIYHTSCQDKETMNIMEKLIHKKLNSKRVANAFASEANREWFESSEDAEDFIKLIEECKRMVCE